MKPLLLLMAVCAVSLAACDAKAPAPTDATTAAATPSPAPAPGPAPAARPAPAPAPAAVSDTEPYYGSPNEQAVYEAYQAPLAEPEPIAVPWAPPPMRVQVPPPQPEPDASWAGGYWVWRSGWVWAPGYWARPPRPHYHWVPPYYEHRHDRVIFVDGFWSPPGVAFVPPAPNLVLTLAVVGAGFGIGRPPLGPDGPFVPPPPGSRWGLIVPAPIGTAPAVVTGAPAIHSPGMHITTRIDNVNRVTNNVTNNVKNTTVVNNVTNVVIEAPASTTLNHQAVHVNVPAQAHLAAAMPAQPRMEPPTAAPQQHTAGAQVQNEPAHPGVGTPPPGTRPGEQQHTVGAQAPNEPTHPGLGATPPGTRPVEQRQASPGQKDAATPAHTPPVAVEPPRGPEPHTRGAEVPNGVAAHAGPAAKLPNVPAPAHEPDTHAPVRGAEVHAPAHAPEAAVRPVPKPETKVEPHAEVRPAERAAPPAAAEHPKAAAPAAKGVETREPHEPKDKRKETEPR